MTLYKVSKCLGFCLSLPKTDFHSKYLGTTTYIRSGVAKAFCTTTNLTLVLLLVPGEASSGSVAHTTGLSESQNGQHKCLEVTLVLEDKRTAHRHGDCWVDVKEWSVGNFYIQSLKSWGFKCWKYLMSRCICIRTSCSCTKLYCSRMCFVTQNCLGAFFISLCSFWAFTA